MREYIIFLPWETLKLLSKVQVVILLCFFRNTFRCCIRPSIHDGSTCIRDISSISCDFNCPKAANVKKQDWKWIRAHLETLTLGNPAAFYDSRETLILSIFSKVLTIMWFCNKFTILLNSQRHWVIYGSRSKNWMNSNWVGSVLLTGNFFLCVDFNGYRLTNVIAGPSVSQRWLWYQLKR